MIPTGAVESKLFWFCLPDYILNKFVLDGQIIFKTYVLDSPVRNRVVERHPQKVCVIVRWIQYNSSPDSPVF